MFTKSSITLELPMLMFIVGTRAALGVGIGLLLADHLKDKRRAVGATLVTIGALTTVPAVWTLLQNRKVGEIAETSRPELA